MSHNSTRVSYAVGLDDMGLKKLKREFMESRARVTPHGKMVEFDKMIACSLLSFLHGRKTSFLDFVASLRELREYKAGLQCLGCKGVRHLYSHLQLRQEDVDEMESLADLHCGRTGNPHVLKIDLLMEMRGYLAMRQRESLAFVRNMVDKGLRECLIERTARFREELCGSGASCESAPEPEDEDLLIPEDEWYPEQWKPKSEERARGDAEVVMEVPNRDGKTKTVVVKVKGRIKYIVVDESVDILRAPQFYDKLVRDELGLSVNVTLDRLTRAIAISQMMEQGKTAKELAEQYGMATSSIYADNRLARLLRGG